MEPKVAESKVRLRVCPHGTDSKRGSLTSWIFRRAGGNCQQCALDEVRERKNVSLVVKAECPFGDRYELISLVGQGGMGSVYKVKDRELDSIFAVKVLRPELARDSAAVKRFEQEASAASQLTHPNLVAVYQNGIANDGAPYLVMDYIEGEDLSNLINIEGCLEPSRALAIFEQLSDALAHAHNKGVVHRDLKPSNVLISRSENGDDFVKIVDFGIAKVMPLDKDAVSLTQTGELFGSPLYMSPEQCLGDRLDARSDIYSIGCLMFEALTGKPPFTGANPIKVIFKHVNEPAPSIRRPLSGHEVPADLETVILRCLEKRPEDRYQTAQELTHDLNLIRDGKSPLCLSVPAKASSKRAQKRKFLIVASSVMLVSIIGGSGLLWHLKGASLFPSKSDAASKVDTKKGDFIKMCTKEIGAHPDQAFWYRARGAAYRELGQLHEAIDDFTKLVELAPNDDDSWRQRAWAYNTLGEWDNSIADCAHALAINPKSSDAYLSRSRAYINKEMWTEALKDSDAAIKYEPRNSVAYSNRAVVLEHMGKVDQALKALERCVMLDPVSYAGLLTRSRIYIKKRDFAKALADMEVLVNEHPDDGPRIAERSDLYSRVGRFDKAYQDAKHMAEVAPNHPWVRRMTAAALAGLGRKNEAMDEFARDVNENKNDEDILTRQGTAYALFKDYDNALKSLNMALEVNPNYLDALFERASVRRALHQDELARKDQEAAEELVKRQK